MTLSSQTDHDLLSNAHAFSEQISFDDFSLSDFLLADILPKASPLLGGIGHGHQWHESAISSGVQDESDCSWSEQDNEEDWQFSFREHLAAFRAQDQRAALITPRLSSKQRRKIHALAHLDHLSHATFGAGKCKRVLITKHRLHTACHAAKRWNPSCGQSVQGTIDPRVLSFGGLTTAPSEQEALDLFESEKLPPPVKVFVEQHDTQNVHTHTNNAFHAIFAEPDDAMKALQALDGKTPDWNLTAISCDYTIFAHCSWPPDEVPSETADIVIARLQPMQLSRGQILVDSSDVRSTSAATVAGSRQNSKVESGEEDSDYGSDISELRRWDSRSAWSTARTSKASLGTVATSAASVEQASLRPGSASCVDYGSDVSNSKRKRTPYVEDGYECTYGCGKSFGHAGDRRKHEKIHEDRAHICEICGKAFLYAKDVRRHSQSVHTQATYMAQRADPRTRLYFM